MRERERERERDAKDLHVVASALAAEVTTPKLVINSIKPPYTKLFRILYFTTPHCDGVVAGSGDGSTTITCSPSVGFASSNGISEISAQ